MQIIGHRGAPDQAHENTLDSFEKAIAAGAEIVELDVRSTADGRLAVIHDLSLAGSKVSETSFEELGRMAAKENFSVPDLSAALRTMAGKAKAQIEIKERGYEEAVVKTALSLLRLSEFSIISFRFDVLEKIRRQFENAELGLILSPGRGHMAQLLNFLLNWRKVFRIANYFALEAGLAKTKFIRLIPKRFPVSVWTADDPDEITKFVKNSRLFAVASNKPGLAREILDQITNKSDL